MNVLLPGMEPIQTAHRVGGRRGGPAQVFGSKAVDRLPNQVREAVERLGQQLAYVHGRNDIPRVPPGRGGTTPTSPSPRRAADGRGGGRWGVTRQSAGDR